MSSNLLIRKLLNRLSKRNISFYLTKADLCSINTHALRLFTNAHYNTCFACNKMVSKTNWSKHVKTQIYTEKLFID